MHRATLYKQPPCLTQLKHSVSIAQLVVAEETKKKHVRKNVSFPTAMILDNGIPKTNVPSCGIYLTENTSKVNISGFSPSAIGPKWTFGIICNAKKLTCLRSILHTSERLFGAMDHGFPIQNF